MKPRTAIRILTLLLVLSVPVATSFVPPQTGTDDLVLVGARIYPSPTAKPIPDGVVFIQGGRIRAVGTQTQVKVPSGTRRMDCTGLVMVAGFWNCHVHFMEPQWQGADTLSAPQLTRQLQAMLTRYGFTYAFDAATLDLANLLALRRRIDNGEVAGPSVLTAGVPFTPPGGSPFYIAPLKLPELATAAEASTYVNGQLEAGADAIKVWSASPTGTQVIPMPLDIIQAATKAAHQKHKPVFAHPTNLEGVGIAARGGVDILTHVAPEDRKDWIPETLRLMLANRMALIPTLKLYKWDLERTGHSIENNSLLNTAVQQLRTYQQAGGEILFGTDVGFMSDYSPADEYLLMNKAGMDFRQILTALTTAPARRFGRQKQTGTIAPGMQADLVLLSADPATDVRHFSQVAYTIRQGRIIYH
jgi:imidazolonepropionase-like amidohydrolase